MNVLYLTMNPNRASTTVPTEGWFRLMPAKGLRPVLVSRELGAFHDWAVARGLPAYQNELSSPDKWRPASFLKSLWRLRRIVKRHHIDLIHCNEQDIYPIGGWLARLCGIPSVVSVHFTMGRAFVEWAFRSGRPPERVFFVSHGNLEACREAVQGVVAEDVWRVLPNGLDLKHYQPDNTRRARFRQQHGLGTEVAIGVACAIRPRKQLEHLFEAAARLDHLPLRVFVAGEPVAGDEAYAGALLRQARDKLGSRLVLLGFLDDLRDFLNGLDIFVNTSQEEACSISVIESLACGCPVVGYPSKSVDEQVLPGGGAIVAQDDVGQLTDVLAAWTRDRAPLSERRAGARRRAEQQYDIARLVEVLWADYQTLRR